MNNTEKIRKRYDRASKFYDIFEQPMEMMSLKKWRSEVVKDLKGKVLEVGVGTGKNIPYYPDNIEATAIDFSEKMLEKAREKAERFNKNINLIHMDAQNMDFPDNTFDSLHLQSAFVFVTFDDVGLLDNSGVYINLDDIASSYSSFHYPLFSHLSYRIYYLFNIIYALLNYMVPKRCDPLL